MQAEDTRLTRPTEEQHPDTRRADIRRIFRQGIIHHQPANTRTFRKCHRMFAGKWNTEEWERKRDLCIPIPTHHTSITVLRIIHRITHQCISKDMGHNSTCSTSHRVISICNISKCIPRKCTLLGSILLQCLCRTSETMQRCR